MMRNTPLAALLLVAALIPGEGAGGAAASTPEQRVREEVNAALVRLVANGEVDSAALAGMLVEHSGGRIARFGALLAAPGVANDPGLEVLAVTPGSSAEALGLVEGDRLLAVDGRDVQGVAELRANLDNASGEVSLAVQRGNRRLQLAGPVQAVEVPAYRLDLGAALAQGALAVTGGTADGCGRISVVDAASRRRDLYAAVLIAVDGKAPGPTASSSFRVEPGMRRLTVAEAIDAREFSGVQQLQRQRGGRDRYIDLFVEVEPGRTYRLAAEFERPLRGSIEPGKFWRPVIWDVAEEPCR